MQYHFPVHIEVLYSVVVVIMGGGEGNSVATDQCA